MLCDEAHLANLDSKIEISKLYANYWIAMATTGIVKESDLKIVDEVIPQRDNGTYNWVEAGDTVKMKHALDTASTHINIVRECGEKRVELIEKINKGQVT